MLFGKREVEKMAVERAEQIEKALENVMITLSMLDAVAKREQIPNRMDIAPALERAQQRLEESYQHGDLMYADVEDIFSVASKASRHVWNPRSNDFLHKHAILCVNTVANIEVQASMSAQDIESMPEQYLVKPSISHVKKIASDEMSSLDMEGRDARALLAGLNQAITIEKERKSSILNAQPAPEQAMSRQEKIEMAARLIEEAHAGFDDLPADEQSAMEKAVREVGDLCEVITDGAAQNHAIQSPSN